MTAIEFYFDPTCPFSWAASRWLLDASHHRDIEIDWRQMSLAVLNEGTEVPEQHRQQMEDSRKLGRTIAAARSRGSSETLGTLYTAIGNRVHHQNVPVTVAMVSAALAESGLDSQLAESIDDPTYDDAVRAAHQKSQDKLGDSGGSPIICISGRCFFGPVLTAGPTAVEGVELFDAVLILSQTSSFAQLRRPHNGPPTFSH